ncbi:hypothetical protein M3226_02670 [Neobacillus cucumis]|uniref:hypothetical protein n=1 Tax=Neobacillus cucumis TaxID=1740721 RepID=UPI00203EE126|nr:hypothetical protein [Neobacillus cucumis]MCM3724605.1 hypothetical protein [Neobacillus cucumis]
MTQYYKLVAINERDQRWMFNEFLNGRLHFGWGWPGSNLNVIKNKSRNEMSKSERIIWRYTQFLVNRLQTGDILIVQFGQPLRQFLIAEVTDGYDYETDEKEDFNHFIHCRPITTEFISIESKYISKSMRHALTKRGHYYQIYPQEAIQNINNLIIEKIWIQDDFNEKLTDEIALSETKSAIIKTTIEMISKKWPAKNFEYFIADLINSTPGMEAVVRDSGKGWDLLIRITDPLSNEILLEDIPLQCKNYAGKVSDRRPIADLRKCIYNSKKNVAYLFIMGELGEDYLKQIAELEEELSEEIGREVKLIVVQQERIAEMYLNSLKLS